MVAEVWTPGSSDLERYGVVPAALAVLAWPAMTKCDVHPSNYRVGRQGFVPEYPFWHTASGFLLGGRSWAMNPAAEASWHYMIGYGGEVDSYVDIWDTAIANGAESGAISPFVLENPGVNVNLVAFAIEHEDKGKPGIVLPSPVQLDVSALVTALVIRDVVLPAIRDGRVTGWEISRRRFGSHSDVAPGTRPHCNGWGEVRMQQQINRVRDLLLGVPTATAANPVPVLPAPSPVVVAARDLMTVQALELDAEADRAREAAARYEVQSANLLAAARAL